MRLSTSTNIHQMLHGDGLYFNPWESIEKCAAAGYGAIDVNLHTASHWDGPLSKDKWKEWLVPIQEALQRTGLQPSQSHALFYQRSKVTQEQSEHFEHMTRRDAEASGILGAKWMVMHPIHAKDVEGKSPEEVLTINTEYFKPYGELAEKCGIGIAIENMFHGSFHKAEELLELIARLNAPVFGICWDTGHANLTGQNQPESIRLMGKTLKALHIDDNHGVTDEHLAPYFGNIAWEEIVAALKTSGYEGDFTYEIQNFTKSLPAHMRDSALRFTREIGDGLLA